MEGWPVYRTARTVYATPIVKVTGSCEWRDRVIWIKDPATGQRLIFVPTWKWAVPSATVGDFAVINNGAGYIVKKATFRKHYWKARKMVVRSPGWAYRERDDLQ